MTDKTVERECQDVDETILSFAEIKAIASGNPMIMPSQRRMVEGKAEYQDICYPVTKDFHDRLQGDIMSQFEQNREKLRSAKEKAR